MHEKIKSGNQESFREESPRLNVMNLLNRPLYYSCDPEVSLLIDRGRPSAGIWHFSKGHTLIGVLNLSKDSLLGHMNIHNCISSRVFDWLLSWIPAPRQDCPIHSCDFTIYHIFIGCSVAAEV